MEELQKIGINEIKVTEYFKPTSQISFIELICEECSVGKVKKLIHEIGTTGNAIDHFITVKAFKKDDEKFLLNVASDNSYRK